MSKSLPSVVFMGTPDFAVASLEAIYRKGFEVRGVVTATDKPAGRGKQVQSSPVKRLALEHKTLILQPDSLKDDYFHEELAELNADLFVVVAFRMLPEVVWTMPPMGTINLHASMLPDYRGAAPINWVLMNGETRTGLTTFIIDREIDTGKILMQQPVEIEPNMAAGALHNFMMVKGADLLVETIIRLNEGSLTPTDQQTLVNDPSLLKTAPKLTREHSLILWTDTAIKIHDQIRGLSPLPGASTHFLTDSGFSYGMKIIESEAISDNNWGIPGEVLFERPNRLFIQTGEGTIQVKKIQQAGKKIMGTAEFLRGFREEILKAD